MAIELRRDVRPLDVALTGLLLALGSWLMALDIPAATPAHGRQPLLADPAPVPLAMGRALGAGTCRGRGGAAVVITTHDLLFGHMVRCGAGLPLVFVLAFLSGFSRDRRWVPALILTAATTAAVLAYDTAAGPELLPVALIIIAVLYGVGRVTRSRAMLARSYGHAPRTCGPAGRAGRARGPR